MAVILKPNIDEVTITPNPVNTNTPYILAVAVSEVEIEIQPIIIYCGTFAVGEEEIL